MSRHPPAPLSPPYHTPLPPSQPSQARIHAVLRELLNDVDSQWREVAIWLFSLPNNSFAILQAVLDDENLDQYTVSSVRDLISGSPDVWNRIRGIRNSRAWHDDQRRLQESLRNWHPPPISRGSTPRPSNGFPELATTTPSPGDQMRPTDRMRKAPAGYRWACPSENCKQSYVKLGHYHNHLKQVHPDFLRINKNHQPADPVKYDGDRPPMRPGLPPFLNSEASTDPLINGSHVTQEVHMPPHYGPSYHSIQEIPYLNQGARMAPDELDYTSYYGEGRGMQNL